MVKQTTETGRTLIEEGAYDDMVVSKVEKKEIKGGYIIYEWVFLDKENKEMKISLFSSQMSDLLRALGAVEKAPNKFEWDDEEVVGKTLNFNVVHVQDKKGVIREQLSEIMRAEVRTDEKSAQKKDWGE